MRQKKKKPTKKQHKKTLASGNTDDEKNLPLGGRKFLLLINLIEFKNEQSYLLFFEERKTSHRPNKLLVFHFEYKIQSLS